MATGTRSLDAQKGFGFIQPVAGGKDVFVHFSAVERAGLVALPNERNTTSNGPGNPAATNLSPG